MASFGKVRILIFTITHKVKEIECNIDYEVMGSPKVFVPPQPEPYLLLGFNQNCLDKNGDYTAIYNLTGGSTAFYQHNLNTLEISIGSLADLVTDVDLDRVLFREAETELVLQKLY